MRLFDEQIYPPWHWPLGGVVPESFGASHRLSRSLLTLPCDQRYGETELRRMVTCVRNLLEAEPQPRPSIGVGRG